MLQRTSLSVWMTLTTLLGGQSNHQSRVNLTGKSSRWGQFVHVHGHLQRRNKHLRWCELHCGWVSECSLTFMSVSRGMWSLKSSTELTKKGMWHDNTWGHRDESKLRCACTYAHGQQRVNTTPLHLSVPPERGSGMTGWRQWWSSSSGHCPPLQQIQGTSSVNVSVESCNCW